MFTAILYGVGAVPSAAEIKQVVELVLLGGIPAIFPEKNGSDATAQAISRETGCAVVSLDMMMSGDGVGLAPYLDAMEANLTCILEAFS